MATKGATPSVRPVEPVELEPADAPDMPDDAAPEPLPAAPEPLPAAPPLTEAETKGYTTG